MGDTADPSVFEDTERRTIDIEESDLLGEHVYSDVLYTGETDVVDVTTGKTPDELNRSVADAKEFAARTTSSGDAPRVAKRQPSERAVESRSPYTSCAFFHYSITSGMNWHTVFRNAWESEAYDVQPNPDYETGTLRIRVEKC